MTSAELIDEVSFLLGHLTVTEKEAEMLPLAVKIAFRELKRYMKTPVSKTVPFSTRIDLLKVGIKTQQVLYVSSSRPRIGLTLGTIESGNVFQVAASVNTHGMIGQTDTININPILTEMAMAQVRNTLSTDFQWSYDAQNQVVYCTHRDPRPASVTIMYVPEFTDVSEIVSHTWEDYLVRLTVAHMKTSLGRSRSKYKVEGSNVSYDGEILLQEASSELEALRTELEAKKNKLVALN